MKILRQGFLAVLLSFAFLSNVYAVQDPVAQLQGVTDKLISSLKSKKSQLDRDPSLVYGIVDQILVPHLDHDEMARWVAGRNAWQKSTAAERQQFSQEFLKLVIRTYAGALHSYDNQEVEYFPLRGGYENKNRVQVQSKIIESGKASTQITYRLVQRGNSWKVYDMVIEGVSLMKGFQSQFSEQIRTQGLAAVTVKIKQHNRKQL